MARWPPDTHFPLVSNESEKNRPFREPASGFMAAGTWRIVPRPITCDTSVQRSIFIIAKLWDLEGGGGHFLWTVYSLVYLSRDFYDDCVICCTLPFVFFVGLSRVRLRESLVKEINKLKVRSVAKMKSDRYDES